MAMRRRAYGGREGGRRERDVHSRGKHPDWRNTNDALVEID